MKIYCTSKNTGPSWSTDPLTMLYLGTSVVKAVEAVGTFIRYKRGINEMPKTKIDYFTALPNNMGIKFVHFYFADGWWYSIVEFELNENEEK